MNNRQNFLKGIFQENPVFAIILGMCPVLAITTSVINAVGMGVAFTVVLILSNIMISLFRKLIPDEVRIPAYIVIIATLVTIVDLLLQAFAPTSLYEALGIFIPLIVVNCVVLGRAEAYANKNNVMNSIIDAAGMGVGYSAAIIILATIRETLGNGTFLGYNVIPYNIVQPAGIFISAPGAFICIGLILGIINAIVDRRAAKKATAANPQ